METQSQLAYRRIWKWCLAFEVPILAVLGFSISLWCGFTTLVAWAITNFLLYRDIVRPTNTTTRLGVFCVAFAILNALAFVLSGIFTVIWNNRSENIQIEKIIRSAFGTWSQMFLLILLAAIFFKILVFAIAAGVRAILQRNANGAG